LREAAGMVLAGWSLNAIAVEFHKRGLRGRQGGKLVGNSFRQSLTNHAVTGLRIHRGELVGEGNWTPILDRDTWEAVRARLGGARTVSSSRMGGSGDYIVSGRSSNTGRRYIYTGGLTRCGVSDAPWDGPLQHLRYKPSKPGAPRSVPYYKCHPRYGGRACTGIMGDEFEATVREKLFARLSDKDYMAAVNRDEYAAARNKLLG